MRVGGRVAAPQLRLVDDVVVQQRRRVDHLDHGRQRVMIAARVAAGVRREQQQRRPQTLAAAADDVVGDLPDQHDVRRQALAEHAVDRGHVVADDGIEEVEGHEQPIALEPEAIRDGGRNVAIAQANRTFYRSRLGCLPSGGGIGRPGTPSLARSLINTL